MPADWTTGFWVTVCGRRSASSRRFTTAIDCRSRKNWSGSGRGPRRYAAACRRSRWTDAMNSPSRSPRTLVGMAALGLALVVVALARGSGNAHALESGYGSSMGSSVNGTGALAALLRNQGHEVRTAWRLTAELAGWADVIVRFAFAPGPPNREEARWHDDWLESRPE